MALKRCGVLFKCKNPGKVLMTGKLQVSREQLQSWANSEEKEYKDTKYFEVEIGLFKNTGGGTEYFPIMEFIGDKTEGATGHEGDKNDDSELPF